MTKILVVDDAEDAAASLAMLFEACGHETHVGLDGQEGVAQARRHVAHIVFLGLDMPVMDGFGAAKAIRESAATDDPFIVALSAKTGEDVLSRTIAAGFDFYVPKPADVDVLLALVDDLQGRQRVAA